ncbi:ABC transporter substrate-binding protein [Spirosoma litoris]
MSKFGFLVPRSTLYPGLSFDLLEGIKTGMAHRGLTDVSFTVENIGFGTEPTEVHEKAEKLLLQGVDVVIAFMERRLGDEVAPLFVAANRLLFVLDVLGDVDPFTNRSTTGQPVFYHSLQTSLGCWLTARAAADEQKGSAIMATSFYDAGYPACQVAAQQGLHAEGGQTAQYFISSHRPELFSLDNIQTTLNNATVNAITALFCGDLGALFLKHYQSIQNQVPVYASPFLLEEQWLSTVEGTVNGITGFVAWSEHLDLPANRAFIEAIRRVGRQPTIFSMLAWEGGLILADWLATSSPTDFSRLTTIRLDGPRGPIAFDAATHFSFGPFYRTTIVTDETGKCRLGELAQVDDLETERQRWLSTIPQGETTGWRNQYLCI